MIKDLVIEQREAWRRLDVHNLPNMFVIKHGIEMPVVAEWTRKLGPPKMCYKNAFEAILADRSLNYVEGFCTAKNFAFPFAHAWVTKDGKTALDPTLKNPSGYEYYGIVFPRIFVMKQVMDRAVYGLMVNSMEMVDWQTMVKFDPSFKKDIDAVTGVSGGLYTPRLVHSKELAAKS